jgi:hypothetical protein
LKERKSAEMAAIILNSRFSNLSFAQEAVAKSSHDETRPFNREEPWGRDHGSYKVI